MKELKQEEWNRSYENRGNFIFYPHEAIIRFVSKYIKKRVGLDEFVDQNQYKETPKVLDFGCGIGRHVKLLDEFKLDGYGFDLSEVAIKFAQQNFIDQKLDHLVDKIRVADITNLPFNNDSFDFMLSHGVLDSMPFEIAKKGMSELNRCMKKNGKMYFDVISTSDSSFEENVEKTVKGDYEKGTIQTYFDESRIQDLIEGLFVVEETNHIKQENTSNNWQHARYHIVVRKK